KNWACLRWMFWTLAVDLNLTTLSIVLPCSMLPWRTISHKRPTSNCGSLPNRAGILLLLPFLWLPTSLADVGLTRKRVGLWFISMMGCMVILTVLSTTINTLFQR